jgi:hypothetical protein
MEVGIKYDREKPDLLSFFNNLSFKKEDFYKKIDIDKTNVDYTSLDYSLVPDHGFIEMVKCLMYGAMRYGRDNWKYVVPLRIRYAGALLRHLFQLIVLGEEKDQESGLGHGAHIACCSMFICDDQSRKNKE